MLQRRNLGTCMLVAVALACALAAAPARAQTTGLLPPQLLTGPSWIIKSIGGMSIAHDGSGGIVFLQDVNGAAHVFASRLEHGSFQPGEQIDSTLPGPATQTQIAADSGGQLVVVFIEAGALWATEASGPQSSFNLPQLLATNASNPSLSINRYGDGYVAFTVPDGNGDDVDVESYSSVSGWAPASPETMNETPGDDAGTGESRPSMVAAQDGVGIVAWGESGHIYSRRLWGTATSVETEQLDPSSVDGSREVSASDPVVGAGGNSSFVDVTFREKVANAGMFGGTQSRVLMAQLMAEDTDPAIPIDGLGPGAGDDGYAPNVSMSELGSGFATNLTAAAGQLIVTPLGGNGTPGAPLALADPGGPGDSGPYPALSSLSGTIAWQQSQGTSTAQIDAASESAGGGWEPAFAVSDPTIGPTDAKDGLQVGADGVGDTIFAWVQDAATGPELDYAEQLVPPGAANPKQAVQYSNTATPTLTWPAARQYWGAVTYTITMDGVVLGQSSTASFAVPAALSDGPHDWTVTTTNAAGEQSLGTSGTVFIDTTKPKLTLRVNGTLRVGTKLALQNVYSDGPNTTEPGSSPSGVASVTLAWGDGSKPAVAKSLLKATHTYRRRGSYKLTVTVTDRAGNATTVTRTLKIGPALKPGATASQAKGKRKPAVHARTAAAATTPAATTTTPTTTTPTTATTPTTPTTPTTTTPTVTLPTATNTLTTATGTATVIAATGATTITTVSGRAKRVAIPAPEAIAPVSTDASVAPYSSGPPPEQALASDGQDDRFLLDGTWLYQADPGDVGITQDWESPTTSTGSWSSVSVPNSFNAGDVSANSFYGSIGWYRRDFTLPAGAFPSYVGSAAQAWVVQFESVNYGATVWLNGHLLGRHSGASLPFEFTIPLSDLVAGVNTLVVRVNDVLTATDFPPRNPGGGWWNFGGILDGVYLRPVARADIDSFSVQTPIQTPGGSATIEAQASIRNVTGQPQTVTLTGSYGPVELDFGTATIPAGAIWQASASGTLAQPQLWAPGSPTLYQATLSLTDGYGRHLASYDYESGVRTIAVSNGLVYLNGRQLSLRGVNLHEQNVASGAALSVAQQAQLIDWVKQLNATIIRAHYPLDQEMEQMADEDGILLWSEVPVYHPGNDQLASPTWRASAVSLVQQNIVANQAHPSILLWSVGNELGSPPQPGQATYVSEAAAAVHELDPTRPAAIAVTDWPGLACQSEYNPIDVIGVNAYFDWFDSGGGTTDDRNQLGPFLDSVRKCYPSKGLFISEFGFGGNRNGPTEVRGTYQYQVNSLQFNLGVFGSKSWLAGAMYFPLQDFAASPGFNGSDPLGIAPYVDKGMLDQYGNQKPSFAVMQQLYGQQQQIAPAPATAPG